MQHVKHPDSARSVSLTNSIARWHEVALTPDKALLEPLLADDACFESPVVHTPQHGKTLVLAYLGAAGQVFSNSNFRYVGEWRADNSAVLEFEALIDGITINGVDIITWNTADLIRHFKVMIRPLKAINLLHRKMGEILLKAT